MQIDTLFQGDTVFSEQDFDLKNFRRYLNYPEQRNLPDNITGFLETLLPGVQRSPVSYQYRVVPLTHRDKILEQITLHDDLRFEGPMVFRLLHNCDLVVVHMLSLSSSRFSDDWQSFVSYCFNNTLIQMSSDTLRARILDDLDIPKSRLTPRYAPGYCGWHLSDQNVILKILQPENIGVTYSDAFTLQPAHTITGIYGVRRDETNLKNMPCYKCTSISCGAHFDFLKELSDREETGEQFS